MSDRLSLRDHLKQLPPFKAEQLLDSLSSAEQMDLARGAWWTVARPTQLPPAGDWMIWVILAGRGFGKAVAQNTPIVKPSGWTIMGNLSPGDFVFDEAGKPTRVLGVYDNQPERAYRLTFSDGTTIDASADHEWTTWTHAERKAYLRSEHESDTSRFPADWPTWRAKRLPTRYLAAETVEKALLLRAEGRTEREIAQITGANRLSLRRHLHAGRYLPPQPVVRAGALGPRVRTTAEIIDTLTYGAREDLNHCIPVAAPLDIPEARLPMDPWVLGMWLGDGSTGGAAITTADRWVLDELGRLGFVAKHYSRITYGIARTNDGRSTLTMLRECGVLGDKHIPAAYLRASSAQRLALLQGLMDSDGFAHAVSGHVEFCAMNEGLAHDVVELARSLGQKPVLSVGRATLDGRDMGPKYRVNWRPTIPVFRLPRKLERLHLEPGPQGLRNHHRMIVAADEIDPVPMRCITVDSPNRSFLAGLGMIPTHNSRSGSEWLCSRVQEHPRSKAGTPTEWAAIAETLPDCRDTIIEGESGLLAAFERAGVKVRYRRSPQLRLDVGDGQKIFVRSADDADVGRGWNLSGLWMDEIAKWKYSSATWAEGLAPALRADLIGDHPRALATTTPKRVPILRDWLKLASEGDPSVAVTRGSTYDNSANLSRVAIAELRKRYEGTRLGRQELHAEMLDDIEGALFTQSWVDETRVGVPPEMKIVVVALDPAVTVSEESDESGLIVAGLGVDEREYVLADWSRKVVGMECAALAWKAFLVFKARHLVVEDNQGGKWVKTVLTEVWEAMRKEHQVPDMPAPIRLIHAKDSKQLRAEPVALRYEQGRVSHVGLMAELESQMTSFVPGQRGPSPDRLDALVHGLTYLAGNSGSGVQLLSATEVSKSSPLIAAKSLDAVNATRLGSSVINPDAMRLDRSGIGRYGRGFSSWR